MTARLGGRRLGTVVARLSTRAGGGWFPGPRPVIAPGVLPTLRRAILGMQLVVIRFAGPNAEEPATRILSPYGLLSGGRGVAAISICYSTSRAPCLPAGTLRLMVPRS